MRAVILKPENPSLHMTLLNRTCPCLITRADGNASPSPGGGLGMCGNPTRAPHGPGPPLNCPTRELSGRDKQPGSPCTAKFLLSLRSARLQDWFLEPGQHMGFWNGQAGTRGLWSGMTRPGCRKGRRGDPQCRMPADRMPGPRHRPPLLLTRNKAASADPVRAPAVIVSGAESNGRGVPQELLQPRPWG